MVGDIVPLFPIRPGDVYFWQALHFRTTCWNWCLYSASSCQLSSRNTLTNLRKLSPEQRWTILVSLRSCKHLRDGWMDSVLTCNLQNLYVQFACHWLVFVTMKNAVLWWKLIHLHHTAEAGWVQHLLQGAGWSGETNHAAIHPQETEIWGRAAMWLST